MNSFFVDKQRYNTTYEIREKNGTYEGVASKYFVHPFKGQDHLDEIIKAESFSTREDAEYAKERMIKELEQSMEEHKGVT